MQFSCMATGWFLHQPMHEQSKNHISLIKQAYMQDHFNGVVMCITSSYTLPFWGENCSLATILCKEPKVHGASSCPLRQLFAGTWPIVRFPDRAMYVCIPKSIYTIWFEFLHVLPRNFQVLYACHLSQKKHSRQWVESMKICWSALVSGWPGDRFCKIGELHISSCVAPQD